MSNGISTVSSIGLSQSENPTGTRMQLSAVGAVEQSKTPVRAALEAADSDQVRREVTALVEQRWRSLTRIVNTDYELTGYRATGPIEEQDRQAIRSLCRALTRPGDPALIAQEIGKCLLLTKSRDKGDVDTTLMVAAMTAELAKYPQDLVVWSLTKWSRTETFWPALAEIMTPIKKEMAWRNSLDSAANTVVNQTQTDGQKSSWSTMSEDRKARINEALKRAGLKEVIE